MYRVLYIALIIMMGWISIPLQAQKQNSEKRNVIFILSDDHRYDFMGFMNKVPFLKTPNMDRIARDGVHLKNAFVNTSLCSPSRASILTGKYTHKHKIVDNFSPIPDGTVFFPKYLQAAGYKTAFLGKWHMGNHEDDGPREGFDYWASFKGQGTYFAPDLNINGSRTQYPESAYITDVLTDLAKTWITEQSESEQPFFMYLSHKAVHSDFKPAPRHKDKYLNEKPTYPASMAAHSENYKKIPDSLRRWPGRPDWVREQRYSWHGVDYMYNGAIDFDMFFRNYTETLLALDDSIGEVLSVLEEKGLLKNTVVIYMGDNGFSFGEHGLIDKRHAYEESMRVPLLMMCPELFDKGTVVEEMVMNTDIGPTIMDFAGLKTPEYMDGKSFVPLAKGDKVSNWRNQVYYEYFWERTFPQTPTMYSIRTDRYKFTRYYGVWDVNEFFDIQLDPLEVNNLIYSPEHQDQIKMMNTELWNWLEQTNGMQIPLKRIDWPRASNDYRYKGTY